MVGNKKVFMIILVILVIGIFIFVRGISIKEISIESIDKVLSDSDYTLVFSGDYNKDISKELKGYKKEYGFAIYRLNNDRETVQAYLFQYIHEEKEYTGNIYIIYDRNGYVGYIDGSMNKEEYIKKYLYNYIPIVERKYSEPTIFELKNIINDKKSSVVVLGEDTCSYCKQLEQVINKISPEEAIPINYISLSRLSDEDIEELYNLNIVIPGKCTKSGEDTNIKDGFSKPTTIVMKKGKVTGCIKGYYEYSTYLEKLELLLE